MCITLIPYVSHGNFVRFKYKIRERCFHTVNWEQMFDEVNENGVRVVNFAL